jgi:4-aminobutyrate aminotransferase-like enzyme
MIRICRLLKEEPTVLSNIFCYIGRTQTSSKLSRSELRTQRHKGATAFKQLSYTHTYTPNKEKEKVKN